MVLQRLAGQHADLGRVLDVVGLGMLVPMPPLWAADVLMLATDTLRLPGLAVTHATVQLRETALFAVGQRTVLGMPWARAALAGAAAMSDTAPPKWMLTNIRAIRDNSDCSGCRRSTTPSGCGST
jgi:hypothetical protein